MEELVKWLVLAEDVEHLVPVRHVFSNHERAVAAHVVDVIFNGVTHGGLDPSSIRVISKGVIDAHEEEGVYSDVFDGNLLRELLLADQGVELGGPHLESVDDSHLSKVHERSDGGSTTGVARGDSEAGQVIRSRVGVVPNPLQLDTDKRVLKTEAFIVNRSNAADFLEVCESCGLFDVSVLIECEADGRCG